MFFHTKTTVFIVAGKKNINFALIPQISDVLTNEKRVNYKQLHFSWVTDIMFIQEKQA